MILPYFSTEFKARRIERQKKVGAQSGLYLPGEDISAWVNQSAHSAKLSARIGGIEEMAEMKRFELLRRGTPDLPHFECCAGIRIQRILLESNGR